LKSWRIFIS